jgi:hypothetical protein
MANASASGTRSGGLVLKAYAAIAATTAADRKIRSSEFVRLIEVRIPPRNVLCASAFTLVVAFSGPVVSLS